MNHETAIAVVRRKRDEYAAREQSHLDSHFRCRDSELWATKKLAANEIIEAIEASIPSGPASQPLATHTFEGQEWVPCGECGLLYSADIHQTKGRSK